MKLHNKKIFVIIIITIIVTVLVCYKLWANKDLIENTNLSVNSNKTANVYLVDKNIDSTNSKQNEQLNIDFQNTNLFDENLENANSKNIVNHSSTAKNADNTSPLNTNKNTINSQNTKININTATQTELETLPGIGPSIALKIVNYRRQYGKFKTIEEIKNVSGIGDKKYAKIEKYIKI